jgi:hypothetical protein
MQITILRQQVGGLVVKELISIFGVQGSIPTNDVRTLTKYSLYLPNLPGELR